jgi:hypothetical protein
MLAPDGGPTKPPGDGGPGKGNDGKGNATDGQSNNGQGNGLGGFSWSTGTTAPQGTTVAPLRPEDYKTHDAPAEVVTHKEHARRTTEAFKDIPNYHVIIEQLAHTYAYHSPDLSEADDLPGQKDKRGAEADGLKRLGFRKKDVVASAATGFQVTLFEPYVESRTGKPIDPATLGLPGGFKLRPVLAFRGTDGGPDILDDLNGKGIGNFQVTLHEEQVRAMMVSAGGLGFGLPDLTGHSLGGALAQRSAARCPGLFNDIITFQAPGAGDEAKRVDPKKHASTHYMMQDDLVSRGGGEHTSGQVVKLKMWNGNTPANHIKYPLASLNESRKQDRAESGALPQNNAVPGVSYGISETSTRLDYDAKRQTSAQHDKESMSVVSEAVRYGTSGLVGLAVDEQRAAESVVAEVNAVVDEAVRDGVDRGSAVGRVAMTLDGHKTYWSTLKKSRVPFKPGILKTIETNAMIRFDRSARKTR